MNDWATERNKLRVARKAIIEKMLEEGATKEQMAEATGYSLSSVGTVMMEINTEKRRQEEEELESNVVKITHERPNLPRVEYEGKAYIDVTELFMSSEWMAEEER